LYFDDVQGESGDGVRDLQEREPVRERKPRVSRDLEDET
jgi:hypothetical protein